MAANLDGQMSSAQDANSGEWLNVDEPGRRNVYRVDRRQLHESLTDSQGQTIYKLGGNLLEGINPRKACHDWYMVNTERIWAQSHGSVRLSDFLCLRMCVRLSVGLCVS